MYFRFRVKALSLIIAAISIAPIIASATSTKDLVTKSFAGDYQSQRNLAFSYQNGWGSASDEDYIAPDLIQSCAWRKVILLTNAKKSDSTDYANESIDCKNVHPTENQKVWTEVRLIISKMKK